MIGIFIDKMKRIFIFIVRICSKKNEIQMDVFARQTGQRAEEERPLASQIGESLDILRQYGVRARRQQTLQVG